MTDIQWTISKEDIEWEMDWGETPTRTGKVGKEMVFEPEKALAHMLLNEVIFINSHWWKFEQVGEAGPDGWKTIPREDATWTKEESKIISVNVNCNDVFAWGCADAEELPYDEIENLYRMWVRDPSWGSAIWCMKQRKEMPQKPVEDRIRKAGIWNFEELGLEKNSMDSKVSAMFVAVKK
jgi:hypothetical protein